ncbi:hypothetical protein BV20DRAFT_967817 [Pilatotrama ljubarskyi]|nr:hypothetical protein BV20DRAFT_967817 [Pilatotrama ljubarskyi]
MPTWSEILPDPVPARKRPPSPPGLVPPHPTREVLPAPSPWPRTRSPRRRFSAPSGALQDFRPVRARTAPWKTLAVSRSLMLQSALSPGVPEVGSVPGTPRAADQSFLTCSRRTRNRAPTVR